MGAVDTTQDPITRASPVEVQVVSDGTAAGTPVLVDGRRVDGVTLVEWRVVGDGIAEAVIHVRRTRIEVHARGFARRARARPRRLGLRGRQPRREGRGRLLVPRVRGGDEGGGILLEVRERRGAEAMNVSAAELDAMCVYEAGADLARTMLQCANESEVPPSVPFWGGLFSQWAATPIALDGGTYPTAEHYMMASKARLFGDKDALYEILARHSITRCRLTRDEVNSR